METTVTIAVGAVVSGIIVLDKAGVLDRIFRRNGRGNATKSDIDVLKNNHFHEMKEFLVEAREEHKVQTAILNRIQYILEDIKQQTK